MKVLLIIPLALAFVAQLAYGSPVKRDCDGCEFNGASYAVDDTWEHECTTYKCLAKASYTAILARCRDAVDPTACHDIGSTWTTVHPPENGRPGFCSDYECQQTVVNTTLILQTVPTAPRCLIEGVCVANGGSLDIANCQTQHCSINQTNISYTFTTTPGCTGGTCTFHPTNTTTNTYNVGEQWSHNCKRYTCVAGNHYTVVRECCYLTVNRELQTFSVGNFDIQDLDCNHFFCDAETGVVSPTSKGCEHHNGTCVSVAATWKNGTCFSYECVDAGLIGYRNLTSAGCEELDGTCHNAGTTWTYKKIYTGDTRLGTCYHRQCVKNGNRYTTTTTSSECMLDGNCYTPGEIQTYSAAQCKDVTCSINGPSTQHIFSARCLDSQGVCHDRGTNGWPYVVEGQACTNCTCYMEGTTLKYKCFH